MSAPFDLDAAADFAVFADHLNFTRAAEALHLSQPALHAKVKKLEAELGVPLYKKRGRALELTDTGRELARLGRDLRTQASDLLRHLTGSDSFAPAEDATDFAGLRAQLADAIARVEASPPSAFEGAADRKIELKMPNGIVFDLTGEQFARDWALAQFYFHVTTAYGLLRAAGAPIGKLDFLGGR